MTPLIDPTGTQPLLSAVRWVETALLGSTAVIVATLSVAALGFLMLNGHVPFRRGAAVLVGCFILFGAATLAQGLMGIAGVRSEDGLPAIVPVPEAPAQAITPPPAQPQVYDPYAGAAVPVR